MKLTATREALLAPLQSVIGVVARKQTMPVLANVLLSAKGDRLDVTGTDLEVELRATSAVDVIGDGDVTVPGRKLLDILRALPEKVSVTISTDGEGRATVRSGKSRFALVTLPANEFPLIEDIDSKQALTIKQAELLRLIDKTHFSMAAQDVRYYLNGLCIETEGANVRAVSTDGHRLAFSELTLDDQVAVTSRQVVVPRKGVLELQRILGAHGVAALSIGTSHIRAQVGDIRFTSKLIDGRFPEYGRVIPKDLTRKIEADRDALLQALQRTSILSHEKYRGIRLGLKAGMFVVQANNTEQEEAEDQVEIEYEGEEVEIGFNSVYLLDVLNAIDTDKVVINLTDSNSSCLIHAPGVMHTKYVVMPMRV